MYETFYEPTEQDLRDYAQHCSQETYSVHFKTYAGSIVCKWSGPAAGHADALNQARKAYPIYSGFEATTYKGIVK